MVEAIVCWYLQGNHESSDSRVSERRRETGLVHPYEQLEIFMGENQGSAIGLCLRDGAKLGPPPSSSPKHRLADVVSGRLLRFCF